MKRKLAFVFFLVVLAAIGFLGYSIYEQLARQQAVERRIATLPELVLETVEGKRFSSRERPNSLPTVITYFKTDCPYCKAEITDMKRHPGLLNATRIALISNEPIDLLKRFNREFGLNEYRNIVVCRDSSRSVMELFGVKGVPATFVYTVEGNLIDSFQGETKADLLYRVITAHEQDSSTRAAGTVRDL